MPSSCQSLREVCMTVGRRVVLIEDVENMNVILRGATVYKQDKKYML